jgi:hypothetical protein
MMPGLPLQAASTARASRTGSGGWASGRMAVRPSLSTKRMPGLPVVLVLLVLLVLLVELVVLVMMVTLAL